MKKIYFALMMPVVFMSTFTFAATTEQIIIDAGEATLNRARIEGKQIDITSSHDATWYQDSYTGLGADSDYQIFSKLSDMRSQAELYYSNTNTYGPTTSSCSAGMFASTKSGGLKTLMTSLYKDTKTVKCAVGPKGATWAVSAKTTSGQYICVDSAGALSAVGGLLKNGVTKCSLAPKMPQIKQTMSSNTNVIIFPKTDNTYDLGYFASLTLNKKKTSTTKVLINKVTYSLINDWFVKEVENDGKTVKSFLNKYLATPQDTSLISQVFGIQRETVESMLKSIKTSNFTAQYLRTNKTGEAVYKVTMPYRSIVKTVTSLMGPKGDGVWEQSMYILGDLNNNNVFFEVWIQNGLITKISAVNQKMIGSDITDIFNAIVKLVPGSSLVTPANTVNCLDITRALGITGDRQAEACNPMTEAERDALSVERAKVAQGQAILSSMRAHAELYYSMTNGYGPATQSCTSGIFADKTTGGLAEHITSLGKYSTDLSCVAGGTISKDGAQSWRASARISDGTYWCSDSTGNSSVIPSQKSSFEVSCK